MSASALHRPWRIALPQTYSSSNPTGMISFALASNSLVLEDLSSFAAQVPLPLDVFTYGYSTAGGARLRAALASHLNLRSNPHAPLTIDDVQLASGATAVQSVLAFALASPGEGILTSRPVYGRFELDFGNEMGVEVVYADTAPKTCFEPDVVETLVRIMQFCEKHKIHLISDEIYGLSVFSSSSSSSSSSGSLPAFTSVLSIDTVGFIDPDLVHVEYGVAKDFAAPGMRLGLLVSRNWALHEVFYSVVRFHSPAGPSVAIAAAMFEDRT
ncbi:PLP-dependent transferase [Colletotrichum eremochloae]|nr:PLP-dependent transferase [Colletotrichum eremochloae]